MVKVCVLLVVLLLFKVGVGREGPRFEQKEPSRTSVRVRTVSVNCSSDHMEVRVRADLFGLGVSVDPGDLRLGGQGQSEFCGVTSASDEEFIIESDLTSCGTQHWVTDDALIYTNVLTYSMMASPDALVRMESAVIPVECHFRRTFDVGSDPVLPTWIPHNSTVSVLRSLHFSLRLMTRDWRWERGSAVYFLGDDINIEASVYAPRKDLRIFIDHCVATTTPETDSEPRYEFIDNGCFVDAPLTRSNSRFLQRESPEKLRLQLSAFIFPQVEAPQIYITCSLKAYPLDHVSETMSKACSYTDRSWRSVDGDDWTCSSCPYQIPVESDSLGWAQTALKYPEPKRYPGKRSQFRSPKQANSSRSRKSGASYIRTLQDPAAPWRRTRGSLKEGSVSAALEQETSIGPLSVFTRTNKHDKVAPPRVSEGIYFPPFRGKKPVPHHSLWKNGDLDETDLENEVTIPDEEKVFKALWRRQPLAAEDSAVDGTPAPEAPLPLWETLPSTVGEYIFFIPAVSPPERNASTASPEISPTTEKQELAMNTEELAMNTEELAMNTEELAMNTEELAMNTAVPDAKMEELAANTAVPDAKMEELAANTAVPDTKMDELATNTAVPDAKLEELATNMEELVATVEEMSTNAEELTTYLAANTGNLSRSSLLNATQLGFTDSVEKT
ncbi:uncharacterized protein [Hoplias malabaricus]|uniref:uncharacterized protein n=1 Tax=Hoplias malabaricus TaxID=27720 RepID=UPI003462E2C0